MSEFTKSERRELRGLSDDVYQAEAHLLLEELDAEFQRWREGELLSSELLAAIHEFHQHASRDLWSRYQFLKDPDAVARGVALGFIERSRLSEALSLKLESAINYFSERPWPRRQWRQVRRGRIGRQLTSPGPATVPP